MAPLVRCFLKHTSEGRGLVKGAVLVVEVGGAMARAEGR